VRDIRDAYQTSFGKFQKEYVGKLAIDEGLTGTLILK
jgi:hypothetical protein